MTRSPHTNALRDDAGFTLVELLVAMTISIVILFGILMTLDQFTQSASRQTRVTDANDQARKAMDRIVADLRQAAQIEVADADDLVYAVTQSASVTRRERVCLDGAKRLWRTTSTTGAINVTAIAAGAPCPMPSTGGYKITPLVAANTLPGNPLFRYDAVLPAPIRSVGLTFALNAGNSGRADVSTLRASTFVRSEGETKLAVNGGSISTSCNTATRVPTLTLASSVGSATVQYTDTEGNVLGSGSAGTAITLSSATPTATTVIANITTTTGLVSQLVKTLECSS